MRFLLIIFLLLQAAQLEALALGPINFSYYLRYNGPAIGKKFDENYNFFVGGTWPVHFFHSLSADYRINSLWKVGAEVGATQDLASGVIGSFGLPIKREFTIFHPSLFITRYSLWETDLFNLTSKVSFFLPTSEFAKQQTQIVSVNFNQNWSIKKLSYPWSASINTNIQPTLYRHPHRDPNNFNDLDRRLWFFSVGHFLGYRINSRFEINTSTTFDIGRYSSSSGFFNFDTSSNDRFQITFLYYPRATWLTLGTFLQGAIDHPALKKTVLGGEASFYF
jgi:hypothetical protein